MCFGPAFYLRDHPLKVHQVLGCGAPPVTPERSADGLLSSRDKSRCQAQCAYKHVTNVTKGNFGVAKKEQGSESFSVASQRVLGEQL